MYGLRATHDPMCLLEELVGGGRGQALCWRGLLALEEGVECRCQIGHGGQTAPFLGGRVGAMQVLVSIGESNPVAVHTSPS